MPGYLHYFCAEWRRLRRVLNLEEELLCDFVQTSPTASNIELDASFDFVQKNDLQGWTIEIGEELLVSIKTALQDPGTEKDVVKAGQAEQPEKVPTAFSPKNHGRRPRSRNERTAAFGRHTPISRAASPRTVSPHPMSPSRPCPESRRSPTPTQRSVRSATPSSMQTRSGTPSGMGASGMLRSLSPPLGFATSAPLPPPPAGPLRPILFVNPSHPLANLPASLGREEFVQEIRKRLRALRLFRAETQHLGAQQGGAGCGQGESVLTAEESDDLFDMLLQMQKVAGVPGASGSLQLGKQMDSTVDAYFQLLSLRNAVERGAPSISAFVSGLEGQDANVVDATLLKQFIEMVHHRLTAETGGALPDSVPVEMVVKANAGIEIAELRRRLTLVAPPGISLAEVQAHIEVRHGFGRAKLPSAMDLAQLCSHLCEVEHLDISPEDVARYFRVWGGAPGTLLNPAFVDDVIKRMPVEALWGIEPFVAEQLWCALGTRCLQLERLKKMDASLPPEAIVEVQGKAVKDAEEEGQPPPEQVPEGELRERFDRLWNRCVGSEGLMLAMPGDCDVGVGSGGKDKERADRVREKEKFGTMQMKEACFSRYLISYRELAAQVTRKHHQSVFLNVSDILSASSVNLRAGQVVSVRYRLAGACNYWHPAHRVMKDEREPLPWPVPRKVLGETPFVALVPRGLRWTSAGGGGFYLGTQAFNQVDPGLRADLPLDRETGQPLLFGSVELVAPFLLRGNRRNDRAATEEFEFRMFSSRKNRIIGCVGEPVRVKVTHQVRPPPMATVQVCCDGRNAKLRWSGFDLGPLAPSAPVETIRLYVKTDRMEQMLNLKPDKAEFELHDMLPDVEYEFNLRLESQAGAGREASCTCRTNSRCSMPTNILRAAASTTQIDLQWKAPEALGNEQTKDRWQLRAESVVRYEAKLFVGDDQQPKKSKLTDSECEELSNYRRCLWPAGSWTTGPDGTLTAKLTGLRPDTLYMLEGFCAVNSMGNGVPAQKVNFWTLPLCPIIESIRVRQGIVIVTLSEVGGACVKEFETVVVLQQETKRFASPEAKLRRPPPEGPGSEAFPELPLEFNQMPVSNAIDGVHIVKIRAKNPGGWSNWSDEVETVAIARQQGADQAQALLVEAMELRKTHNLEQVLHDVQDIEFYDDSCVVKASALLSTLQAVEAEVDKAMEARDPTKLEQALEKAHEVCLPDLEKAEDLLATLKDVCRKLDTAKGIDALRLALREGHEARLPPALLQQAVERLGTREAAQHGLEMAMEAARVPVLKAALEGSVGMDLPSEDEARALLEAISHSQHHLEAALQTQRIVDLQGALDSAAKSGLREEELIKKASDMRDKMADTRDSASEQLAAAMEARYPDQLDEALKVAAAAQVYTAEIEEGTRLLRKLEELLANVEAAVGSEQRTKSLKAAEEAKVPPPLLAAAENQLECFEDMHVALVAGDVPATWRALKLAEVAGVKEVELAEPRKVYEQWSTLARDLERAVSLAYTERLRVALANIESSGICQAQLQYARNALEAYERRDAAEVELQEALKTQNAEEIQSALRLACDAEFGDKELVDAGRTLLDRLLSLRLRISKAVESTDMERLFHAIADAKQENGLPLSCKELLNAERILGELQDAECARIERHLKQAREMKDFRAIDGLLKRAAWAQRHGMKVGNLGLEAAEELAMECQDVNLQTLQEELHQKRVSSDWPAILPSYMEDTDEHEHEKDSHSKEMDLVNLPSTVVSGEIQLDFYPRGIQKEFITMPREIVEVNIRVLVADANKNPVGDDGEEITDPLEEAREHCSKLLNAIEGMLAPEDSLRRMASMEVQDDGAHRHVAIPIALYLRGKHSTRDVIEAFLAQADDERPKEDDRVQPILRLEDVEEPLAEGVKALPKVHKSSVVALPKLIAEMAPECLPSIGSDCLFNVRGRVLRRITTELFWTQPANYSETLDATCLAMSGDQLVEVINARGLHGAQYGVDQQSYRLATKGVDAVLGAVTYLKTDKSFNVPDGQPDDGKRLCKHSMGVRLDLLPERVTDLFFVLAATNSRDLAKFTNLGFKVLDADIGADLALHKGDIGQLNYEAVVVMCSIYRLGDKHWRVGSTRITCQGSPRDFKPAISKLGELGYPRNRGMASQEHVALEAIRRYLELPRTAVKTAAVKISQSPVNTISIKYAVEVMEGEKLTEREFRDPALAGGHGVDMHTMARGEGMVRKIAKPQFRQALLDEMYRFTSEKVSSDRLRVQPAAAKPLNHLGIEVRWEFGEVKRMDVKDHSYLDGALLTFAKRNLQEVIDYRGPHGVRIVHNSVVDYSGIWIGPVGTGDAADGAVTYAGQELDELPRTGKCTFKVKLDELPPNTTDIFVFLCSPSGRELSKYNNIAVGFVDADEPGYEVSSCLLKTKPQAEGMVFCRLSRTKCGSCGSSNAHSNWKLGAFRTPCPGGVHDYRPVIDSIRAMQQKQYEMSLDWPHKISLMTDDPQRLRASRRLRTLEDMRNKSEELKRQDSTGSITSLLNWSPNKIANSRGHDPVLLDD
eukprot:TRINITY_DN9665_c0_g4_i1.p1 TRINITY_DN9665_c0_g4~~TRINITY_DN9665_c0_g4_i1.p1  ORF type:complete len:2531 (+),score=586.30 TRINITY_DN9665_c0_g4_i1:24-7595(+)